VRRNLRVRGGVRPTREQLLQRVKQVGPAGGPVFLFQQGQNLCQHRRCPAALVDRFGSNWIGRLDLDLLLAAKFFQWDKSHSFASLGCHRPTPLVSQKIFQRPKQIRTKSSFVLANRIETVALQKLCKKPLSNILRLLWPKPLTSHKAMNGSPIRATKLFEGFLCCRRSALRLQYYAPVRGAERTRAC